jgi:tRNA-dihydrouridine synthase
MKIRNLSLENPVFLAPMAEVNDIAFRVLCTRAGAGLAYTGMINPLARQKLALDDRPAIQLFCISPKGVAEFIQKHERQAALFDFNLGCPSRVAKKCGFGAFMHHRLGAIEEILKTMRHSTDKPVTVKLRKSAQTLEILRMAEKYCDAIGIHPRTEQQGYSGEPDMAFALKLKKKTKLPVIYSGNVNGANANALLKSFDFLMIGRSAMGHPEVFAEWQGKQASNAGFGFGDYLKLAMKYRIPLKQVRLQAIHFTSGREGAKEMRIGLMEAKTLDEIRGLAGFSGRLRARV